VLLEGQLLRPSGMARDWLLEYGEKCYHGWFCKTHAKELEALLVGRLRWMESKHETLFTT
jgi:hypothetical protein